MQTTFYFDLGSPYAYLTAERLGEVLLEPVAWQPISLGGLFKVNGRSSWAVGDQATRVAGIEEVERRAQAYGLPEVRWPQPWPSNYLFAMRIATFAFLVGRGEDFTRQAFRDAFQHGRDLGSAEQVLRAAEQAGLDPRAARAATEDPQVKQALRAATDDAHAQGVIGVPTLAAGGQLFWGDDRLADVAKALGRPLAE
jgi:2-hydroxychromene-2-carboxylate isomerase